MKDTEIKVFSIPITNDCESFMTYFDAILAGEVDPDMTATLTEFEDEDLN